MMWRDKGYADAVTARLKTASADDVQKALKMGGAEGAAYATLPDKESEDATNTEECTSSNGTYGAVTRNPECQPAAWSLGPGHPLDAGFKHLDFKGARYTFPRPDKRGTP